MPATLAAAWSSAVNGVRAGNPGEVGTAFGGAFLGVRFFVCAKAAVPRPSEYGVGSGQARAQTTMVLVSKLASVRMGGTG